MSEYITQKGDTWDSIAHKIYGNAEKFTVLITANIELSEVVVFDFGTVIKVPADAETDYSKTLPPWRVENE